MYRLVIAVALLVSAPTFALANGGGSSKKTGTLNVVNKSTTQQLLVAVDPSDSLKAATTASEFTARGGKIVNASGSVSIPNLKAGKRSVFFAFVSAGTTSVSPSSFAKRDVNVVGGKTVTLNLTPPTTAAGN